MVHVICIFQKIEYAYFLEIALAIILIPVIAVVCVKYLTAVTLVATEFAYILYKELKLTVS